MTFCPECLNPLEDDPWKCPQCSQNTVNVKDVPIGKEWIELLEAAKSLHGHEPKSWRRLNMAIEAAEKLTGERKPEVEA